ncbi:MAG: tetratricopeptide repeat protein, partial [Rhodospirillales bacterium]
MALGRPKAALKQYRAALRLTPDDPRLFNGMGVALDLMGAHLTAQARYREGLKITPDNASLRNNLGLSLVLSGNYADAIASLGEFAEGPEGHASHRQILALAYGFAGRMDRAAAIIRMDLDEAAVQNNLNYIASLRALDDKARIAAVLGYSGKMALGNQMAFARAEEPEPLAVAALDSPVAPYQADRPPTASRQAAEPAAKPARAAPVSALSHGTAPATAPAPSVAVGALQWPRQGHTLASTAPGASIPANPAPVSTLASAPEPAPIPVTDPVPVSDPAPAPIQAADPTLVSNPVRTMEPAPDASQFAEIGSPFPPRQATTEANGLGPPDHLRVGQRNVLPRGREHVVRGGETLYGISRLNGLGVYEMARTNGLKPPYTISVGQRLRIPRGESEAGKGKPAGAKAAPGPRPAEVKIPAAEPASAAVPVILARAELAVPQEDPNDKDLFDDPTASVMGIEVEMAMTAAADDAAAEADGSEREEAPLTQLAVVLFPDTDPVADTEPAPDDHAGFLMIIGEVDEVAMTAAAEADGSEREEAPLTQMAAVPFPDTDPVADPAPYGEPAPLPPPVAYTEPAPDDHAGFLMIIGEVDEVAMTAAAEADGS